ncbi:ribonuclease Z [Paenibacillus campi]|uniref:ribonuclease Z n=1 Tax=Paenibacillus campi TaxID=3106031 RepID=UPI002AFE165A|nr:ribonuclease Z [Paenibacillus sp. SGZ-1014]
MELYFLGTNAGVPTLQRNVTSIGLRLYEERKALWMFDCGEGTQHQVLRSQLKLSKLEKIFITHLHGDHLFGLPGLLSSRSNQGGLLPLTVYGPPGVKRFIEMALELSQSRVEYELAVVEHEGGIVFEDDTFRVEAALLEHRIDSYGYRIVEKDRPGQLNFELLKQYGIQPGPIYGELKNGGSVQLQNGEMLHSHQVVGEPKKGKIVTILGDTRPCANVQLLAQGADLLVHEATFLHDMKETARQYYHSTAYQAAVAAHDAGVQQLILTHFSSRYKDEQQLQQLLAEAKTVFPHTELAIEHQLFPVQ